MKQKKENRVALLLHWAGEQKSGCSWQFFYRRSVAFALSFLTLGFTG